MSEEPRSYEQYSLIEYNLKWIVLVGLFIVVMLFCVFVAIIQVGDTLRATPPAPTPMIVYVDRPVLVAYPSPGEK